MSKGTLGPGGGAGEDGDSKPGARYTEAEWQQMVMGLKRENKESIEKLRKEQDEALFKVRLYNTGCPTMIISFVSFSHLLPFRLYRT